MVAFDVEIMSLFFPNSHHIWFFILVPEYFEKSDNYKIRPKIVETTRKAFCEKKEG